MLFENRMQSATKNHQHVLSNSLGFLRLITLDSAKSFVSDAKLFHIFITLLKVQ